MGDFNFNFLNCSNHQPTDDFVNTFYSYGFHPLIDQRTRITPKSTPLIDNIRTNNDDIYAGILNIDISDHLPLFQITPSCFLNSTSVQKSYVTREINCNTLCSFTVDIKSMDGGKSINPIKLSLLTILFFLSSLTLTITISYLLRK